ncbi:MAG TPA: adenylate/guanylate cyclase domain-containing protein [Actinomycetota bacterium]|jgi:class 3 adenylate cyclase|nr:adenylate/guanylate cyclase domain-containing protein [Actinomycetota bacterium]
MDSIDRDGSTPERPAWRAGLRRLRLRFGDSYLESTFRADQFRHNLGNIRFAFLAGIGLWVAWGLLLNPRMLALSDQRFDTVMRFGVFIPMLVVGFALTFTRFFRRMWEWFTVAVAIATLLLWVFYVSRVLTLPAEYGYVGVILITAFTYALLRLRFVFVVLVTVVGIAAYLPYALTAAYILPLSLVLATLYLVSFGILGLLAAYRTERFTRDLFLRERQLDQERARSDGLLLNILPQAIVEKLKTSPGGRIAQAFDQVSVVFADAVGSTGQAARSTPEAFADSLDELFRTFDAIADRHGLEKIKTIGDAYMAVAGAPTPIEDHAEAAVAMALDVLAEAGDVRWPSGDPIVVRVGVASGPAVAGVVGVRKFAYDLWGDTVNLASRLEEYGEAGHVLVSESTAAQVADRYDFAPARMMDLKGKGPTPVRFLLGRRSDVPVASPASTGHD